MGLLIGIRERETDLHLSQQLDTSDLDESARVSAFNAASLVKSVRWSQAVSATRIRDGGRRLASSLKIRFKIKSNYAVDVRQKFCLNSFVFRVKQIGFSSSNALECH